jgi:RNA-directed DNA polymerase
MKRHGNLWEQICGLDNIKFAHKQARRGKAYYTEVKMVDADIDRYAQEIRDMLIHKTFTTSPYEIEERCDGRKMRTIYKLPYYPDRIVQHALLNIIGPIIVNSFIRDSFQSIVGRGTSDAMRRVKKVVLSKNCPKYALKIDIEKYYPSINNNLMKAAVRRKIKDKDALWLVDDIIDSMQGLPIGNYTSQHFGNLYLNQFDWWMKQIVKPIAYFRYCDDIVVMENTKSRLIAIKVLMNKRLTDLHLKIKNTWNVYNIYLHGIDFVGYVFTPFRVRLRKTIATKFKTACKKLQNKIVDPRRDLSRIMSYKGWVKRCNAKMLWRTHTDSLRSIFPKQLRSAV